MIFKTSVEKIFSDLRVWDYTESPETMTIHFIVSQVTAEGDTLYDDLPQDFPVVHLSPLLELADLIGTGDICCQSYPSDLGPCTSFLAQNVKRLQS